MTIERELKGVLFRQISPTDFLMFATDSDNNPIGAGERVKVYHFSNVKNFLDKENKKRKALKEMAQKGLFDDTNV